MRVSATANGIARLDWVEQPSAVFDGISGRLSTLDASLTGASCLFNDRGESFYSDFQPVPPSGDGYFYLLRAQNSCGASTYGRGAGLDTAGPCR